MGICESTETTSRMGMTEIVPPWVYTAVLPPGCERDGLSSFSDGFQSVNQFTVMRHRFGGFDTDCARWSKGFTSGKHVFEIVFPELSRGTIACLGVGTEQAPLHSKGKVSLLGANKHSWGIDLRRKQSFHRGERLKRYPSFDVPLPDKIYMYLDCDSGSVLFASDFDYYGCALSNIKAEGEALFPMVAATVQGATITMVYRGQGQIGAPPNLSVPPPGPPIRVVQAITTTSIAAPQGPPPMISDVTPKPPLVPKSVKIAADAGDVVGEQGDIPIGDVAIPEKAGMPTEAIGE